MLNHVLQTKEFNNKTEVELGRVLSLLLCLLKEIMKNK